MVLATAAVYEPLVRLADCVDRVVSMSSLDCEPPADLRPDLAVNLHGRGPQSHRLLMSMRPGRLVAFAHADLGPADGPAWRSDEHEVERWCRLVAESLTVPVDAADLLLARPALPSPVPGAVVVHPGAAHAARRWPGERFAAVAAWATASGSKVVVTGSAQERDLAAMVAAGAGLPGDAVLAGQLTLAELAALVASARLVICGDTGVAHLATAYRTRSVVLFGPTPPSLWGPPPDRRHTALWRGAGSGDPWGEVVDPALLAIGSDDVVAAAESLLDPVAPPSVSESG